MVYQRYEHHLGLLRDKRCPFLFNGVENVFDSVCNWHRNIEILLVTDGSGYIQYRSENIPLEKHDVIVVNSGELHRMKSDVGISFSYMIIDESFCRENGIDTGEYSFFRNFKSEEVEKLFLGAFERYHNYKNRADTINVARLRLSVLALLAELCENYSSPDGRSAAAQRSPQSYVKAAIEYLDEHYAEAMTLDEVADFCGITKYHLSREFRKYTGQTVITHLNALRCKKADICLARGMTVTEAALENGFESVSYFSRTYKKLMGFSPSSKKISRLGD